ncbi:MAG: hypothetical protein U9Q69_00405, partial [Nanoarchaeota archaeon]|nr:hypothetical protein [Nanoarchaeota archaeon]
KFLSPPSLEELQLQALEDETKAKKKASDRVKIHVNAHTFDLGEDCVDVDADEADPLKVASYAYTADEVLSDKCQYDSITDKYVLSEAVCVDGELLREEYPCGDNEVCQDGKCGTAIQDSFCVDTDQQTSLKDTAAGDLSSVFETKGATAGYYAATSGQSFGIWADYCATANLLVEYSCQEKKTRFTTVHCKGGCIEANCQAPFCYDTDGADNPVIYGMIRGIDETGEYEIEDVCMDDLTLVEYYCDISEALGYGQREVQCSDPCSEGSCIPYGSPLSPDTTLELEMPESFSCDDDADCDFGKICVAESCTAGCRSDLGCMIGNRCVNNECVLEEQGFNNAIIKAKLQRRLERMEALEGVVDSLGGHPIEKEIKSFASSKKGFLSRMITRFF